MPQPDGSYRLEDSSAVFGATRAFYESYGDDYDFVVLWTDFLVQEIWQFSLATRVDIQGNGDGSFVSTAKKPLAYAPLELYTMGLLRADAAELQGMFYVDAPFDFSPASANADSVNGNGVVTFRGERVELSMSTIVTELGPRVPDHRAAQRDFRFAFVLLCATAESCSEASLAWLEGERQSWPGSFDVATGSRARATTEL